MPTNDERREVAARLRSITDKERSFCFTEEILAGCIGTEHCLNNNDGSLDDWLIFQRIADLIEPEPERVLTLTLGGLCPECKMSVGRLKSYCGWCGARMVENG